MTGRLSMTQARKYIRQKIGRELSRATIYNWAKNGVTVVGQNFKLPIESVGGKFYTTAEDVDTFLSRIDQR